MPIFCRNILFKLKNMQKNVLFLLFLTYLHYVTFASLFMLLSTYFQSEKLYQKY